MSYYDSTQGTRFRMPKSDAVVIRVKKTDQETPISYEGIKVIEGVVNSPL